MKVLKILSLAFLLIILNTLAMAQADCIYNLDLYVYNEKGETLNNAEVKFRGRDLRNDNKTNAYVFSEFTLCSSNYKGVLEVRANKFDEFKKEIELKGGSYKLILQDKKFGMSAILEELAAFRGIIKDRNGKAIPNVKVILIDENENRIETLTNQYGSYHLDIESGEYTLEIIGIENFAGKKFENYKLVKGYNKLDVTLNVQPKVSNK